MRTQHNNGNLHRRNVAAYYAQFIGKETQEKIDKVVDAFEEKVTQGLVVPSYTTYPPPAPVVPQAVAGGDASIPNSGTTSEGSGEAAPSHKRERGKSVEREVEGKAEGADAGGADAPGGKESDAEDQRERKVDTAADQDSKRMRVSEADGGIGTTPTGTKSAVAKLAPSKNPVPTPSPVGSSEPEVAKASSELRPLVGNDSARESKEEPDHCAANDGAAERSGKNNSDGSDMDMDG